MSAAPRRCPRPKTNRICMNVSQTWHSQKEGGMKQVNTTADLWYLCVHGGKDKGNNLLSFDSVGKLVSTHVLDTSSVALRELRGFLVLQDGGLLVTNAHKG